MDIEVVFRLDDRHIDGTCGLCVSVLKRDDFGDLFWFAHTYKWRDSNDLWVNHEWVQQYKVIDRVLSRPDLSQPYSAPYLEGDL